MQASSPCIEYSDVQLGHALNVHRSTAFRWRKAGMNCFDLEAAKAFILSGSS